MNRLTDSLIMTIVVDWDVKSQTKQTNNKFSAVGLTLKNLKIMIS